MLPSQTGRVAQLPTPEQKLQLYVCKRLYLVRMLWMLATRDSDPKSSGIIYILSIYLTITVSDWGGSH